MRTVFGFAASSCRLSTSCVGSPSHRIVTAIDASAKHVLDEWLDFRDAACGSCSSKILIIAARWMPASTASSEPVLQFVAVDLTRSPVTLSSIGPPPAP